MIDDLIEAGDLNGLLRAVDGLCETRSWDDLLSLIDKCEHAIERGKQLWPIVEHVYYRLALEAPGPFAADALRTDVGRFSHGPLTEVAASTHTWDELAPHIKTPQAAAYVAQERVLRGEDLSDDSARTHPEVLEMPYRLEEWEPTYSLATFFRNHVEVQEPWEPKAALEEVGGEPGPPIDDSELVNSLLDVVQTWTTESNGAAQAVMVEGPVIGAVMSLCVGAARLGAIAPEEGIQRLAWAAASGGAHGRRRGAAFGRYRAWDTTCTLSDLEWPPDPDELGRAARGLDWYRWDEGKIEEGWVLRLAVEDRQEGWSAAIAATDLLSKSSGPTGGL